MRYPITERAMLHDATSTLTDPTRAKLRETIARHWGYDGFLPLQERAMESVLAGRDSLVVLPTGGGKSLCFQAPALLMDGLAVVVSPLISLMKDQVDGLADCGVHAACLNSSQSPEEQQAVIAHLRSGALKLLYVAPERLVTTGFMRLLGSTRVSFFAIDEAHCISQWGHDFRPEYRALRMLKQEFPGSAVHGYTATATPRVRDDIAAELALADPCVLVGSFDRPNLIYRVQRRLSGDRRIDQLKEVLARHHEESGIVYCITRKEVDALSATLAAAGHRALPYHAGLDDATRHRNQDAFVNDDADIVVATVAFGMGIDKSNVRFVIHAGLPKSLECYQQESGRAGRDGLEAECTLFFGGNDLGTWLAIIGNDGTDAARTQRAKLNDMYAYATGIACRHGALVGYFGQSLDKENCGACDVCMGELQYVEDARVLGQKILCCVVRLQESYGAQYTTSVLKGAKTAQIAEHGHDRLSTYGLLAEFSERQIRDWTEQLVTQDCLAKDDAYGTLRVTPRGWRVIRGQETPRLLAPAPVQAERAAKTTAGKGRSWAGVDRELFESLRALRLALAKERGVPAYIVLGDATLRELARRRPTTRDGFLATYGIGERKCAEYGDRVLAHIAEHCRARNLETNVEAPQSADAAAPARREAPAEEAPATPGRKVSAARDAFALFKERRSVLDVAAATDRAVTTSWEYLCRYAREEKLDHPAPWVEDAVFRRVCDAARSTNSRWLKTLFKHMDGEVPYEHIRLALECLRNSPPDAAED